MNHPGYEEWLAYLEGATQSDETARLTAHLGSCPQCAAEIAGWRRSIQRLQESPSPQRQSRTRRFPAPLVKWGIAASFLLGLGFGLGRLATGNEARLKAALLAELRDEVRQDVRNDLLAALNPPKPGATNDFDLRLRSGLADAIARNAVIPAREQQRLAGEILQAMAQVMARDQAEQREATRAMLSQWQTRQAVEYLSLRRDLENLATTADDRLQQAHWQLAQLATDSRTKNTP